MDFLDALRRRFRSPAEVMTALGLDHSLLENARMTYTTGDYDRHRHVRDALRRAADADLDDPETLEELVEILAEEHPEVLGRATREIGEDGRGPHRWARDRRALRMSRDTLRLRSPRRAGDRPTVGRDYGPPGVGQSNRSPTIENFAERRGESRREEEGAIDRRRAHDMAYDSGGSSAADTFIRMFGRQAFEIQTQR
jgi:hypothetical protein